MADGWMGHPDDLPEELRRMFRNMADQGRARSPEEKEKRENATREATAEGLVAYLSMPEFGTVLTCPACTREVRFLKRLHYMNPGHDQPGDWDAGATRASGGCPHFFRTCRCGYGWRERLANADELESRGIPNAPPEGL